MRVLLFGFSSVFGLVGFGCWVRILIDAFQDEWWKGLLSLFCFFYSFYYGLFEFEHDQKWPIVLGAFGCPGIAFAIMSFVR